MGKKKYLPYCTDEDIADGINQWMRLGRILAAAAADCKNGQNNWVSTSIERSLNSFREDLDKVFEDNKPCKKDTTP